MWKQAEKGTMTSLYDDGWRQGAIFDADLPFHAVVLGPSAEPEPAQCFHRRWVVASQDCDLDGADVADAEPCIEVRPVYTETPPTDWGIRSQRLLLTQGEYVVSSSPRLHISPAVLTMLDGRGTTRRQIEEERRPAFARWLGLRYDRPAVPPHLVGLARRISDEVARRRHRSTAARVRDVLMQFDDDTDPVRFSLFAVLDADVDEEEVRVWLAEVGTAIPTDLGIADRIEAATADGIAYSVIETSYAADVTQVTWRPGQPGPEGAT
jgi:hypothetical protein